VKNYLHASPLHRARRPKPVWWRKHGPAIRVAFCFAFVGLATISIRFFQRDGTDANLIWGANALLLTYLLLAPRWRWAIYLTAGITAMAVGSALIGETWKTSFLYNGLNLVEVLIGALLLRRKSTQLPRFTDPNYLVRFVCYAVLAGPIIAGSILALIMAIWRHTSPVKTLFDWVIGDGLGAAVVIPTFAAIFQTRFRDSENLLRHWFYPLVLGVVTVVAFSQNGTPFLLLILPFLVLVLMRLGLGFAALATLLIAVTASWYTSHGSGPFAISKSVDLVGSSVQLQFFVACCIFMIYIVSVILEERSAIEQRLQEIASMHALVTENSRDVILLADLEGRRTYVSPAIEKMKGWKPEELIDRKFSDRAHPDDRERLEGTVRRLRLGSEDAVIEYRKQDRKGEYGWVEASLRMFRDRKTGIPAGILSLIRDISERKRSEEALLRTEKLAATGRLAASIAHEINNPLEAITNLLFLLRESCGANGEALNYVTLAEGEVQRMSAITQQTLRFYRQSTSPARANVAEILDSVLNFYSARLDALSIRVERNYDPSMDLYCYSGELRQVVANLVSNALDASSAGGRLIVRARRSHDWSETTRDGVRFTVADTGAGMDAIVRRRLFEAFFTTKGSTGTGLGLWVSHEIIHKHRGKVHVRSRLASLRGSSGTVIQMFFPDNQELTVAGRPAEVNSGAEASFVKTM
jgi:PAS domain S-box-containing protein